MANITGFNLGKNRKKYIDFVKRIKDEGGSYSGVKGRDFKKQLNSLLEYSPSLAVLPNTTKGGKLPTIIPADGSADFTVSRNSTKWVLGKNGYLYEVPANQPAIEFNPDGSYKGVLVESQSTNAFVGSEIFTDSNRWSLTNANIVTNAINSPSNSNNASKIVSTSTSCSLNSFPLSQTDNKSFSIFVKKGSSDWVKIGYYHNLLPTRGTSVWINISTLEIGNRTNNVVTKLTLDEIFLRDYGNGWVRIGFYGSYPDNAGFNIRLELVNGNGSNSCSVNDELYVWGSQWEVSTIPTSYIPTTTGTATRFADNISLTNASSLIGQTEGTLFVEVDWQDSGTSQLLFFISDGTVDNSVAVYYDNNADKLRGYIESNNVVQMNDGPVLTSLSGIQKIAFVYKQNDAELYRNGSSIFTDSVVDLTSLATLTNVDFAQNPSAANQANMWIRDVRLYKTRLSDAQCIDLTT